VSWLVSMDVLGISWRRGRGHHLVTWRGLQRFAVKIPGCPSVASNLHDRQKRQLSSRRTNRSSALSTGVSSSAFGRRGKILGGRRGAPTAASRCERHHKICTAGPVPFPYGSRRGHTRRLSILTILEYISCSLNSCSYHQLPSALGRILTLEQIFIGWNGTE